MIPYLSIEFFNIGPLTIYSWGFFVALAFLIGMILSIKRGKKIGIEAYRITNLIILVFLGAIAGSRLFFILQWPAEFFGDPLWFFRINQGGMMLFGGFFGGFLAGWLYIRKWKNRWLLLDALTPIIPLCLAIGRLGCFLINDHEGAITSLPWGILWPDGMARHPVALYLILFDLALAGFLWWRGERQVGIIPPFEKGRGGWILEKLQNPPQPSVAKGGSKHQFLLFLILYSLGRFLLDFTRYILADPHFWGLAASQWISLLIVIFTVFIWQRINSQKLTKTSKLI